MKPLDELFKNKLDEHSVTPSIQAWAKVEANITKKNKATVWLRIAACLALACVGLATYNQLGSIQSTSVDRYSKATTKKHLPKVVESTNSKFLNPQPIANSPKSTFINSKIIEQSIAFLQIDSTKKILQEQSIKNEKIISELLEVKKEIIAQVDKPLVIEYTLEPVEDQPKEVTPQSRLQKMVDFALDAKHSDGALTTLRQAKDNLFAFNFKKDKSKTSNN